MITLGLFMGILTMLLWGVGDFFQAFVSKKIGAMKTFFIVNLLILICTIPFAIYYFIIGKLFFDPAYLIFFFIASCADLIGYYSFMKSLEIGNVSINSPISASYPVVTVLLSVFILKEVLSSQNIFAIVLILIGVALISTNLKDIKKAKPKGIREAFFAMFFFGILFFTTGYLTKKIDPFVVFIVSLLIDQTIMVIFSMARKGIPSKKELAGRNILLFAALNAVFVLTAWFTFTKGMSTELVSLVSAISSLFPAVTVMLAIIFLKEKLVLNQKIGILVILTGIVLISL